ncbi:MAG: hypothetical protein CMK59_11335 [Proteobacteria bacterium]|nr:hypothetical protein [Pseudomonadota bacterium]
MTFSKACDHLVRLSQRSEIEGDLDLELIDMCFTVIQANPAELNPELAEYLHGHYLKVRAMFDKEYLQTRDQIYKVNEGRKALRSYVNKDLKSEPRHLFRDI